MRVHETLAKHFGVQRKTVTVPLCRRGHLPLYPLNAKELKAGTCLGEEL